MAVAIVFSGQGAQYSGMGSDLYENSKAARDIFDISGMSEMCFNGSADELSQTITTQPAVLAMDLACAAVLRESGITADCTAGFSLGEIAALTYADVFNVDTAFQIIRKRAELMSKSVDGGMVAVLKLSDEKIVELAVLHGVYAVNYNCPGQVTVAGLKLSDKLDAFCQAVTENGGRTVKLAVSGAFHSPYMKLAADNFYNVLHDIEIGTPTIPVYSNLTAVPYTSDVIGLLSKQMMSPVKWRHTIENMIADGIDTFIEAGPGKVLSGLIKRISKDVAVMNVDKYEDIEQVVKYVESK